MVRVNLKPVLQEKGITQKELCQMIHARPSTVCDLCNNNAESIKLRLLEDICKALDCNLTDIFEIV